MNERDKLIAKLIKEKGGSREDYLRLLDTIAFHESGETFDPTLKQHGGGPGRGKYQFEVGKNKGAITAAKRTAQYFKDQKLPVPEWLKNASSGNNLDASELSSEQQDILFLGNMRQHPKADFAKVWGGHQSIKEFWLNNHWAGSVKDRPARAKSFDASLERYKNTYPAHDVKKKGKQTFNPERPGRDQEFPYISAPQEITPQERRGVYDFISREAIKDSLYNMKTRKSAKKETWENKETLYEEVRNSRKKPFRQNPDGTTSSHLMMDDNENHAWPSLFQEKDGTWTELESDAAKARAIKQKEYYTFDTPEKTRKFAREGAWKNNSHALGGQVNGGLNLNQNIFNAYNEGGTHEQNKYGGVLLGMGPNGIRNSVEEGESSYNFKDGKYIFSNRLA